VVFGLAWLVVFGAVSARADENPEAPTASSTDIEEGKARFAAGRAHFDKGDFKGAMDEFEAGFALTRINGFLLNIGVCQRKLGQKQEALDTFEGLLKVEPNLPKRSQVEQMIAELKKELGKDVVVAPEPAKAEAKPEATEETAGAPAAAAPAVPDMAAMASEAGEDDSELISTRHDRKKKAADVERRRRPVPMLESSRLAAQANPDAEDESILKSGWLWGGVGAVVVGVVVAVLLTSGQQTEAGSIGTVDLR